MRNRLKATVAAAPRYMRSGRALIVPLQEALAGDVALKQGALAAFRERYGDPATVLWPGRPVVVVAADRTELIGKARVVAGIEVPGAALPHALGKLNADIIRRREQDDAAPPPAEGGE